MVNKRAVETPECVDTQDDAGKPPRIRLKLATAEDVKRELGRIYRQARTGEMDVQDVSRMANVLQIMSRLIETAELERRLERLESVDTPERR